MPGSTGHLLCPDPQKKKNNHHIFSSQVRADPKFGPLPGGPPDANTLAQHRSINPNNNHDVILPHVEPWHHLEVLKRVLIIIIQILLCRALKHKVLLIV